MIQFANYGQDRELNATPEELEVFNELSLICSDLGLSRKSNDYLTATIHDQDVARFKYSPRAKWIRFPYVHQEKITLSAPKDVADLYDIVSDSVKECIRIHEEYVVPKQ